MSKAIKTTLVSVIAAASISLAACSATDTKQNKTSNVTIYQNGAIYTVNKNQPWAEAMVIEDGVITFVGSNVEAADFQDASTKVIDLAGKMMMPGFHDVHVHPLESGSDNNHFELDIEETNSENYISVIKKAANDFPETQWLVGYGHDINTLLAAKRNPLDILDDAVSDRPVIIMEQTSHSMWVNSKALELVGFNRHSADPIGGIIMKDDETGEPNGILIDNAGDVVMEVAMAPTPSRLKNDYDGLVEYTLPEMAKYGITSISDARAYWKREHHLTWKKVEQNNELTARVALGLWAYPDDADDVQIDKLKSLYSNNADGLLRINQIKLYSDGIATNTTAAMHTPYEFDLLGIPDNSGLNYFSEQRIEKYIKQLEPVGFDFHIHAIGERGIHEALNAVEISGSDEGRHRITHVEILNPADYLRFEELNVTADCQVAGDFTHPEHWSEMTEYIGEEKADNLIPLKSLQEAGARVTLSSDWSVSDLNPFVGLQNAVTRAPQNLSLEQAIGSYTLHSAYVMRQEGIVGSIEVGKEADIVVLSQNLFEVDANNINKTKVLQTLLAGEEVYRDAGF